jgi:hypothetical protein
MPTPPYNTRPSGWDTFLLFLALVSPFIAVILYLLLHRG